MGLETGLAIAGLVVSAVGTAYSISQQSKANAAQKEANAISSAQARINDRNQRRQAIREERIRRAKIEAAASITGTSGSSGEAGALGALSTNLGSAVSAQSGQVAAVEGINRANQRAANAISSANNFGAVTNFISGASFAGSNYFSNQSKTQIKTNVTYPNNNTWNPPH